MNGIRRVRTPFLMSPGVRAQGNPQRISTALPFFTIDSPATLRIVPASSSGVHRS